MDGGVCTLFVVMCVRRSFLVRSYTRLGVSVGADVRGGASQRELEPLVVPSTPPEQRVRGSYWG